MARPWHAATPWPAATPAGADARATLAGICASNGESHHLPRRGCPGAAGGGGRILAKGDLAERIRSGHTPAAPQACDDGGMLDTGGRGTGGLSPSTAKEDVDLTGWYGIGCDTGDPPDGGCPGGTQGSDDRNYGYANFSPPAPGLRSRAAGLREG